MAGTVPAPAELLLGPIFEVAPVGLGFVDSDRRYRLVNPALAAMNGRRVDEHLGRTPTDILGDAGVPLEELIRRVLDTGEPVLGLEVHDAGPIGRSFVAHYLPVDTDEPSRGVLAVVEDVTARREGESRVRALVDANVVGVVVASDDEILEANDRFLEMVGYDRADLEAGGLSWAAVTPPEWRALHARKLEKVRETGSVAPYEKECLRSDGQHVPVLTAAAALSRTPTRVIDLVVDLSEQHELRERERAAAERARHLAEMAAGLAGAVSAQDVATVAVRQGMAALGAAAGTLVRVDNGALRLVHHEGYGARARGWDGVPVDSLPGPLPEAMAHERVVTVASLAEWTERYGPPPADVRNQAFAAIPVPGRGGALGALGLAFAEPRELAAQERELLLALGRQVAEALQRAWLYEERAEMAHTLQQGLLPRSLPEIPGVEVALRYQPLGNGAEVGGDFYDLFESGEDEWAVAVGDVCGKGVEAAVFTGMVRHTIRAVALRERDPGAILAVLNAAILRHGERNRFCTLALAKLRRDGDGLRVLLGNGGHLPPLVRRGDGSLEVVEVPGELLGVFGELALEQVELRLGPGDALVFYTDGITDARAGDEAFGEARLQELVAASRGLTAEGLADRLDEAVRAWEPHDPRDDRALVVLRVGPAREPAEVAAPVGAELERVRTVTLDGRPEAAGRARAAATETAEGALTDDGLERLRLLTSELVSNVLRHTSTGRGEVQIRVEHGGVRVEVHDEGRGFRPGSPPPEAESGFGLELVEALADRWGTAPGTVWFEVDSEGEPEPDGAAG